MTIQDIRDFEANTKKELDDMRDQGELANTPE
jgi:hypothetical protein